MLRCGVITSLVDIAHYLRRTKGLLCPTVEFTATMTLSKKDEFLHNTQKQGTHNLLYWKKTHCGRVPQYSDADMLIAKTVVVKTECQPACLIGNDTDLLILLIHHANVEAQPLYFKTETKTWDINKTKQNESLKVFVKICYSFMLSWDVIPPQLCMELENLLHCRSSVLAIHFVKQVLSSASMALPKKIFELLENKKLCVYKARSNETLTPLRCRLFHGKVVSSSSFVKPETLPPTPAAAQYHYFRVYLQVMEWKCVTELMPTIGDGFAMIGSTYLL